MFDWLFTPRCPCDEQSKAWIEHSLQWLSEQFDDHAFNGRRIVLPLQQFFPDRYDESYDTVRTMLDRVCGYMDVEPDCVDMEIVDDQGSPDLVNEAGNLYLKPGGTYQDVGGRFLIRIDRINLPYPMHLVGTIAHELAHVRLMGEGRMTGEEHDNELLTDLTVVFFGLGIFLANGERTREPSFGKWPGTRVNKPEYMTRPMFGYALAHLAWFRGERHPKWVRHLHGNARPDFKQANRYLFETGDSSFAPPKARSQQKRSEDNLSERPRNPGEHS